MSDDMTSPSRPRSEPRDGRDHDEESPMSGTRRKVVDEAPEMTPEELLSTSPFEGDLAAELAAAPAPRRRPPSVTVLLGAGVLLVAGFLGGIQANKQWGTKQASASSSVFGGAAARTGAGRTGRTGGFGGTGTTTGGTGSATVGTVKLVDGNTIYVQTASGGVVPVKTTGSTKISVSKSGTTADIKPGSTVLIQGSPGQGGTVNATSVNAGGTVGAGRFGGGG
jgi:hypothetical protein